MSRTKLDVQAAPAGATTAAVAIVALKVDSVAAVETEGPRAHWRRLATFWPAPASSIVHIGSSHAMIPQHCGLWNRCCRRPCLRTRTRPERVLAGLVHVYLLTYFVSGTSDGRPRSPPYSDTRELPSSSPSVAKHFLKRPMYKSPDGRPMKGSIMIFKSLPEQFGFHSKPWQVFQG